MSDEYDLSIRELRHKRSQTKAETNGNGNGTRTQQNRRIDGPPHSTRVIGTGVPSDTETAAPAYRPRPKPFDLCRMLDALTKRWFLILAGAAALGTIGFFLGFWVTDHSAAVRLMRRQTPNVFSGASEAFQPRELNLQTLFDMMRSPEVLRRVSEKADPPILPAELAQLVKILPDRNPDYAVVMISGKHDSSALTKWVNLYAQEAVDYTKEIQSNEAGDINHWLKQRLSAADAELSNANEALKKFARDADVLDFDKDIQEYLAQRHSVAPIYEGKRIELEMANQRLRYLEGELARQNPASDKLQEAREKLESLLSGGLTDLHPSVQTQRGIVERLQRLAATAGTNAVAAALPANSFVNTLNLSIAETKSQQESLRKQMEQLETTRTNVLSRIKELSGRAPEYAVLKGRRNDIETKRQLYATRQTDAQLLQDNALGYYRVYAPATGAQVSARKRLLAVGFLTTVGALTGFLAVAGLVLFIEVMDSRLKTAADVHRVTKLPVLATLGELARMSPTEQVNWAFRTLTLLQGKLSNSADQSLVCGFISSGHGEGRSTWINLLVSAAGQRGLKILTVATYSANSPDEMPSTSKSSSLLPVGPSTTLNGNVLAFPAQVTEQFNDPNAQPVVHIPLPGWVWSLERRKQWQSALDHWKQIENLVLLIELPPASQPEAVLLAENIPQIIWLASSGMAKTEETRSELETLRHARCNVVGAVLNREPSSFWRKNFSGLLQRFTLLAGLIVLSVQGAEGNLTEQPAPAAQTIKTNLSLTAGGPKNRAPWLERLTLGPGDSLNFALYGHPELTRTNLMIAPDGRLTFWQVQDFPAAGLTIDELRAKFDEEFVKYGYDKPRTMITPVSFQSKKYFLLGKVVNKGVFTLDRPLTIVEAVARAKGLETGWVERNRVEAADLSRSFLIRQGKRLPVDLERLFQQGDLSQNIPLEPDDYLYFPGVNTSEIYVLGEVLNPGVGSFAPNTTLVGALSSRGGFSPRAYKKKILIVRGSLNQPETFIVDAGAVLEGRNPDFKLQPKDIVYVNARPWIKIEELLDLAAEAFVQAAVTTWVGGNVGPVITSPVLPDL
jgi:protein involved in polysaccharide export with SLBB domain/capsular polysaccharide biosynthesis protein